MQKQKVRLSRELRKMDIIAIIILCYIVIALLSVTVFYYRFE